jgi:hypothetical protein
MVADFFELTVVKGPGGKLANKCGARIPQVKDPYHLFP